MGKSRTHSQVYQLQCPCCRSLLWIDPVTKKALKFEKAKKKKGSLDDLLLKEIEKKKELDRKFEATTELEEERRKKAKEKFLKALEDIDEKEQS